MLTSYNPGELAIFKKKRNKIWKQCNNIGLSTYNPKDTNCSSYNSGDVISKTQKT